jgi:arginine/ornithine transport system substrate-binding protein
MMRMSRRLAAIAAAATVLLGTTAWAKDWTKVRIGTEGAYPPFNYMSPDGQIVGFDIDIAMALCERMQVECTLVQQDWDGMIPALLAKKYDAIVASMSITDERRQKVEFTKKYYQTPGRFVAKKGANFDISKEGLAGKKVGVQRATTHDSFLTDNFGDSEIVRYASQDEANLDLVSGRVDLLLADSVTLSESLLKADQGKEFEFVGPAYADPKWFGYGVGIALRKADTDLRDKFNEAIDAIRADGTWDKIAQKYFDFDVYGS